MQAVLGLVPDRRLRAVDDGSGDLLAAVCGQTVQDDRVGSRCGQSLLVEGVRREVLQALLAFLVDGLP